MTRKDDEKMHVTLWLAVVLVAVVLVLVAGAVVLVADAVVLVVAGAVVLVADAVVLVADAGAVVALFYSLLLIVLFQPVCCSLFRLLRLISGFCILCVFYDCCLEKAIFIPCLHLLSRPCHLFSVFYGIYNPVQWKFIALWRNPLGSYDKLNENNVKC